MVALGLTKDIVVVKCLLIEQIINLSFGVLLDVLLPDLLFAPVLLL
jgi:hypothetical protein